jgi:hypothetical protein
MEPQINADKRRSKIKFTANSSPFKNSTKVDFVAAAPRFCGSIIVLVFLGALAVEFCITDRRPSAANLLFLAVSGLLSA